MLNLLRNRKAQGLMEYGIMISVVVGAIIALQLYLNRGYSARTMQATDNAPLVVADKMGIEVQSVGLGSRIFDAQQTQADPYYIAGGKSNFTTHSIEGREEGSIDEGIGEVTTIGGYNKREGDQWYRPAP